MSKTRVVWLVVIGVLIAVLGLWEITAESGRRSAATSIFTERPEPELALPPAEAEINPADREPDVTLTH